MRKILLILVLCWPMAAADITVCAAGCTYTTISDAITNAACGDTITGTAGTTTTFTTLTLPQKNCAGKYITFRSSLAQMLPSGYRPSVSDSRLWTWSSTTAGTLISLQADPAFSSNCFAATQVGSTVTIGAAHSAVAPCDARFQDGSTVRFSAPIGTVTLSGVAIPTSATTHDGLRIGLKSDGKLWIVHKSDVVLNTHFTCTNCDDGGIDAIYNYAQDSVGVASISYSIAGAITALTDRRSSWITGRTSLGLGYPGLYDGTASSAYSGNAQGISHYRFQGIHFRYGSTTYNANGVFFYKNYSYDHRYVPHHLEWDRCVFSQPKASKGFFRWMFVPHCEDCSIRDTAFLNIQVGGGSESQAIYTSGPSSWTFENLEIDGATENIMAGGDVAVIAEVPQITIRRSYLHKRLEQRSNTFKLVRDASTDILRLTSDGVSVPCSTTACVGYYQDTPYTYNQNSTVTIAAGQSAAIFFTITSAGVPTVYHNSGANVTCAGDIVCVAGTTSRDSFPDDAVYQEWSATAGVWDAANSWWVRYSSPVHGFLHKNLFELKSGRDVIFEGNVLANYWAAGGQFAALTLTPRNQYGFETFQRLVDFRASRCRVNGVHAFTNIISLDDVGGNTIGGPFHFSHLILTDLSRTRWGATTQGGASFGIHQGLVGGGLTVSNVTTETEGSLGSFLWVNDSYPALSRVTYRDNIWIANTTSNVNGNSLGDGYFNIFKTDGVPVSTWGYIAPTSSWRGSMKMSAGAISNSGWNSWADDAAKNFTNNIPAPSLTLTDHFTSWLSPNTLASNLRIPSTSVYSVHNGAYAGPVTSNGDNAGADVDWVETLTDGVVEGYPELSRRWAVKVKRDGTTATVRVSNVGTITLKIGPNQSLKTADLVVNDSTPDADVGGHKRFDVTGLTAGTIYWYTISDGTKVVKDRL